VRKYYRFINGLRKFIQSRMEPEEAIQSARSLLGSRIAAREGNFLSLAEKGIFQYPCSPYLKLLQAKHIGYGDVKSAVSKEGIEAALLWLASEGVFFTVDEFKGKIPVVRNGLNFLCQTEMFDNPFLSFAYEVSSGATRSAGTRIRIDFDYLFQRSLYDAFLLYTHGCLTAPVANWFPVFPGAPGINSSLRFAHIGNPVRRWFSQVAEDRIRVNWEKRWGLKLIFGIHRLYGCPLAEPEFVGLNDAHIVAEWAAQAVQETGRCVVYTFAASAVRVCAAAADANLDITGARFLVTGEPLTPYKKREIEAVGGLAVPVYGISEAGVIAAGCNQPHSSSDCCHLYKDTTAIVSHRTMVSHLEESLDAFLFTSLLYEAPKLLLNVGMGDFGNVTVEPCDCEFGRIGFDAKLSGIRSYEKLTGEGVTFVDTDFIQVIEKELPERYGGRSTDYQLVEVEDEHGLTRLRLLVSPKVGEIDEQELAGRFMAFLKKAEDQGWAEAGTEMWKQSQILQVRREFPLPTVSGKILPFHLSKRNAPNQPLTK